MPERPPPPNPPPPRETMDSWLPKALGKDSKTVVPVSLAFLVVIAYGSYRLGAEKSSVELTHAQTQQLRALESLVVTLERVEKSQAKHTDSIHAMDSRLHIMNGEMQVISSKLDEKK